MDLEAGWGPCEFQLASWALEEEPAAADEVWAPAGLPVEYAALDIFGGTCSSLAWPYAPECSGGQQQQLLEQQYYCHYDVASPRRQRTPSGGPVSVPGKQPGDRPGGEGGSWRRPKLGNNAGPPDQSPQAQGSSSGKDDEDEEDLSSLSEEEEDYDDDDEGHADFYEGWGWGNKVKGSIFVDVDIRIDKRMHRFPASLKAVDESYTVPRIVAIGPYHRGRDHLKQMEKVKRAAATCCAEQSRRYSSMELYWAVDGALDSPRSLCLYDNDAFKGYLDKDIRKMMFRDACFLVQHIRMVAIEEDGSLRRVLRPNSIDILHDVMLLENQLPWDVVRAVMRRMLDDNDKHVMELMKSYIYKLRSYLQDKGDGKTTHWDGVDDWDSNYQPPHLLGLLRYYTVAIRNKPINTTANPSGQQGSIRPEKKKKKVSRKKLHSVSAIDLAEIGIKLTPNNTTTHPGLVEMRLDKEAGTCLTANLYLAPLSLSHDRASYIVNMAALELCTVESFSAAPPEETAVCSYLRLLAIMLSRVEDVHELRERGVLQGGGGLTNEEVIKFFASLQSLRLGKGYMSIMQDIDNYPQEEKKRTKIHAFLYNHKKDIALVGSGITIFATVIGTLASIKQAI